MKLLYSDTAMSNGSRHVSFPPGALLILFLTLIMAIPADAQTQKPTSREIVSEDFTKNRPKGISSSTQASLPNQKKSRPRKRVYRLAKIDSKALISQPTNKTTLTPKVSVGSSTSQQLGVTIWRLRPAQARDTGARMLGREKDKPAEWIPQRIEADTPLHEGDHVRMTIESPRAGYLYVVDRELFADGSMGEAMLIFPLLGTRDDNRMVAGKLIDIPAQEDDPSYFTARRSRADHVGEVLTLILSTSPLDVQIGTEPLRISASEIAKWEKEWGAAAERFELEGGAGEAWTKQEQEAAALKSKKQLTLDDPPPQTIYRLSGPGKKAILVNLELRYTN